METRFPPPGRKGGVPEAFLLPPILKAIQAEFAKVWGIGLVLEGRPRVPQKPCLPGYSPSSPHLPCPLTPIFRQRRLFPLGALSSMETCCLATTGAFFLITHRD